MWLYVPFMNLPSVQESEVPPLDLDWYWGTGYEPFVTLNGKPSQRPSWWHGWERRPWIKLLSGIALSPLGAQRSVDRWTSSLLDTPASPIPLQENNEAQQTLETSGQRSPASSTNSNPRLSSLKMSPVPCGLRSTKCCRPYMTWATALRKAYSVRKKLGRHIGDNDCSSWQRWATPTTRDWKDGTNPSKEAPTNALLGRQVHRVTSGNGPRRRLNPLFVEWLMGFPPNWTRIGWSALAPSAMQSFPLWQQKHLSTLQKITGIRRKE